MDWKTFIVEIVKALAWPAVIGTILILFKKQLTIILGEFAKYPYLRWKLGKNELEIGVKQIREEIKDISLAEPEEKIIKSISKAVEDPKETILSAWEDFEKSAKETMGMDYTQPFELEHALKFNFKIPEDKFKLFIKMKELRDKAAHIPSQILSSSTAIDYSESALKLSKYLKEHKKDKNNNSA
jgi:hypothetical protein